MDATSASPLLTAAITAQREAADNIDAAVLWNMIRDLHPHRLSWAMLEILNHFEGVVRSRPALIAVLLKGAQRGLPGPAGVVAVSTVIVLRLASPQDGRSLRALRLVLKRLLRAYGLRC